MLTKLRYRLPGFDTRIPQMRKVIRLVDYWPTKKFTKKLLLKTKIEHIRDFPLNLTNFGHT
jgi:hypothetical protein